MPEVSVVVPTFNRWPLLSRALDSVLGQREVDLEVIVVDDGSSDETPVRLAEMQDPRLRVVLQEENRGVARARNRGLAEARGEWVAFLDDDDFWAPTRIREHLAAIVAVNAAWGYGAVIFVDRDGPRRLMMPAAPRRIRNRLLQLNVVGPPSAATVRRDLLHRVGPFDEELSVSADWDMWIRLSREAQGALCRSPVVAYWEHADAMHHTQSGDMSRELEHMERKYRDLMPGRRRFGASTASRLAALDDRYAGRRLRPAAAHLRMAVTERSGTDLLRGVASLGGEPFVARLKGTVSPTFSVPEWLEDVVGEPEKPTIGMEPIYGPLESA